MVQTVQLIRDALLDHLTSLNASNKTKGSLKKTKLRDRCARPLARASSLSLIQSMTPDNKQQLVTHSIIVKEELLCQMKCRVDLRLNSKILLVNNALKTLMSQGNLECKWPGTCKNNKNQHIYPNSRRNLKLPYLRIGAVQKDGNRSIRGRFLEMKQ